LSKYKCGRCGIVYTFEELRSLEKIKMVADDPDPKKNYGYTSVCKHCGYRFHKDKPMWKAYGEIIHHLTSLHWLVNKLTHGRLAPPHRIDIELSTVFLELAHNDWGGREPNWYESMFFCHREGERTLESPKLPDDWLEKYEKMTSEERLKFLAPTWTEGKPRIECWLQDRYHTEEQAIEGHEQWLKLLKDGKYLITYDLEKIVYEDPNSKYRFEWRIDFDQKHLRILHGAKHFESWEGTAEGYQKPLLCEEKEHEAVNNR